ncbi:hypothetical protein ATKI12_0341 [Kitasatospora sp. Ki12]
MDGPTGVAARSGGGPAVAAGTDRSSLMSACRTPSGAPGATVRLPPFPEVGRGVRVTSD